MGRNQRRLYPQADGTLERVAVVARSRTNSINRSISSAVTGGDTRDDTIESESLRRMLLHLRPAAENHFPMRGRGQNFAIGAIDFQTDSTNQVAIAPSGIGILGIGKVVQIRVAIRRLPVLCASALS